MDSFNIAVFASGNGSNLQSLLETKKLNNQDSIDVSVYFQINLMLMLLSEQKKITYHFSLLTPLLSKIEKNLMPLS